jgi:hypothetical protein
MSALHNAKPRLSPLPPVLPRPLVHQAPIRVENPHSPRAIWPVGALGQGNRAGDVRCIGAPLRKDGARAIEKLDAEIHPAHAPARTPAPGAWFRARGDRPLCPRPSAAPFLPIARLGLPANQASIGVENLHPLGAGRPFEPLDTPDCHADGMRAGVQLSDHGRPGIEDERKSSWRNNPATKSPARTERAPTAGCKGCAIPVEYIARNARRYFFLLIHIYTVGPWRRRPSPRRYGNFGPAPCTRKFIRPYMPAAERCGIRATR